MAARQQYTMTLKKDTIMDFHYQRSYRGTLKAVILDWAGTTIDYGSFAPTAVFLRLFAERGIQITAQDARSGMGLMKKDHLRTILSRPTVADAWQQQFGKPADDQDVDALFRDFIPRQIEVLKEFSDPIPGLFPAVADIRQRGMSIGSTTGYLREMMDVLLPEAAQRGYQPDALVCPDEVPAGRPYPWMCYQNVIQMGVFPNEACVKVGDTLPDIEEGLNAGMWSVGLSLTGNLLGLREAEVKALAIEQRKNLSKSIAEKLYRVGAHFVIDGIWELPTVLDEINALLKHGEKP